MWAAAEKLENEREVLKAILALVISMAALADRAARLPEPLCRAALRYLHPAEHVAREVLLSLTLGGSSTLPAVCGAASSMAEDADEALNLSRRFMVLALILKNLLYRTPVPATWRGALSSGDAGQFRIGLMLSGPDHLKAGSGRLDTS